MLWAQKLWKEQRELNQAQGPSAHSRLQSSSRIRKKYWKDSSAWSGHGAEEQKHPGQATRLRKGVTLQEKHRLLEIVWSWGPQFDKKLYSSHNPLESQYAGHMDDITSNTYKFLKWLCRLGSATPFNLFYLVKIILWDQHCGSTS